MSPLGTIPSTIPAVALAAGALLLGPGGVHAATLDVDLAGTGTGHVTSNPAGIDCGPRGDGSVGTACSASFFGDDVRLTAVAATGSHFVLWTGSCYGAADTCTVTVAGDETVTAWFELDSHPLVISPLGDGSGRVVSDPPGIDCGSTCSASFPTSVTQVTLTATPDPDSAFLGWSGDCTGQSTTCVVPMGASRQVRPAFSRSTTTLTVSVVLTGDVFGDVISYPDAGIVCGGSGNDCTEDYPQGTQLTLQGFAGRASGGPANTVDYVWEGPCQVTAEGYCNVTFNGSTVDVTFRVFQVPDGATVEPVSVRIDGTGGGRVVSSPAGLDCVADCSATFRTGTTLTLTALADANSRVSALSSSAGGTVPGPDQIQFPVNGPVTADVTFDLREYPVTIAKLGTGTGTVTSDPPGIDCGATCSGSFTIGTEVTITATPDPDSDFDRLSVSGGGVVTDVGVVRFTVRGARQVEATFVPAFRTVAVSKTGTGTGRVTSTPGGIDCGFTCQAEFRKTSSVTLLASPDPSSRFVGFTAPGPVSFPSDAEVQFTVENGRTVQAEFERTRHSLLVSRTGTGSGSVTSSPPGIDCGSDCSDWFLIGSTVTLTASASPGSRFMGWGGACTGLGPCNVTMSSARTVTANFVELYRLRVTRTGNGLGSVSSSPSGVSCGSDCDEYYLPGTTVTLTASPHPSADFLGFGGGGCSGTGPCTLTLNGHTTVTAEFAHVRNSLIVSKLGTGTGVVTSAPGGIACGSTCMAWFPIGTTVTLNPIPGTGSVFSLWGVDCSGSGACQVTLDGPKLVAAEFTAYAYRVDVSRTGNGSGTVYSSPGGISCGSDCWEYFDIGSSVSLNPVPASGSYFAGWSGACSGTGACNMTITSPKSVTANFRRIDRTLTVSRTGNGSGSVYSSPSGISCGSDCSQAYPDGTVVTLNPVASTGSVFTGWSGACSGTGSCSVTMNATKSVTASFSLVFRQLSVGRSGSGSGSVYSAPAGISCGSDCSEYYLYGTNVSLFAVASSGSIFTGWSGACSGTGACNVSMTSTRSVTANFITQYYQVTVTKFGSGASQGLVTSSPGGIYCGSDCWQFYASGTTVTLTASGSYPYRFYGWGGACSGISGPTCTLSVTSARDVTARFEYDP